MKRQILKSLSTLCVSAMALFATSSLVVSCYDDGALWDAVEDVQNDVKDLQAKLEALTSKVDALYTLKFQVTAANELQYSFDGGATWVSTGVDLTEGCDDVSLVDNGDSVTITVGEQSFTIEKPEEIVFEIRSGKVYFASEEVQKVNIKSAGIEDITVMSVPRGWFAEITSDGALEITAPNMEDIEEVGFDPVTYNPIYGDVVPEGYVKVHACSADGKCLVGKISVVVSESGLFVSAYLGKAYFNYTSRYYGFYYGVSTRDTFEEDASVIIDALNNNNWTVLEEANMGSGSLEVPVSEALGSEPEKGVEYVVWAVADDYSNPYSLDDVVYSYYSLVEVTAEEDESKRTIDDIYVDVNVEGAESYIAYAIPGDYVDDISYNVEQMVEGYSMGSVMGKVLADSYSGSLYLICEGTQASAAGTSRPNQKVYLLIMPLDGRPNDAYTTADVKVFEFKTSPLQPGGSVNATAEESKVYLYWDGSEKDLDPYTQVGAKLTSSSEDWASFYMDWFTAEEYALYGEELIIDEVLKGYPQLKEDNEGTIISYTEANPGQTKYFVAVFVDKDGKYGEPAILPVTTKEVTYSEMKVEYTTNLDNGVLKNSTDLEITLTADGGTISSVKSGIGYSYWNKYEGMTPEEVAAELALDKSATTLTPEDGKIVISDNEYGTDYFRVFLPYDEEGNPIEEAIILEYSCVFELDNVITDNLVNEPTVTLEFPEGSYYVESYVNWNDVTYYTYYYEPSYTVKPNGSPVTSVMVKLTEYPELLTATAVEKASGLLSGKYDSYYVTLHEEESSKSRTFNHSADDPAPKILLMTTWEDEDGNVYYKEFDYSAEFAALKMELDLDRNIFPTPAGNQYKFSWDAIATAYQVESVVGLLDFGATLADNFLIAYDPAFMGAPAGTPYQVFGVSGYKFEAVDATSGKLIVTVQGMGMDAESQSVEYSYSNLTATSCDFDFGDGMMLQGQSKVSGTAVTVAVDVPM